MGPRENLPRKCTVIHWEDISENNTAKSKCKTYDYNNSTDYITRASFISENIETTFRRMLFHIFKRSRNIYCCIKNNGGNIPPCVVSEILILYIERRFIRNTFVPIVLY